MERHSRCSWHLANKEQEVNAIPKRAQVLPGCIAELLKLLHGASEEKDPKEELVHDVQWPLLNIADLGVVVFEEQQQHEQQQHEQQAAVAMNRSHAKSTGSVVWKSGLRP